MPRGVALCNDFAGFSSLDALCAVAGVSWLLRLEM
jgi:hypothetical protein